MAQIKAEAKQDLLRIIKEIRLGKKAWNQRNFYKALPGSKNVSHCVGGWYIVELAARRGIYFDDWRYEGNNLKSNKWRKFVGGNCRSQQYLREVTGCEDITLITHPYLKLDEIEQNIMEMTAIDAPQETPQERVERLERELAEAREKLNSLPKKGDKFHDSYLNATYIVSDIGNDRYILINRDNGSRWSKAGNLKEIDRQIKANSDFVKLED